MALRPDAIYRKIAERRGAWRYAGMAFGPLGALYGLASVLRRRAWSIGIRSRVRAGAPVISIGNIEVGGVGKTPVTVWLARRLVSEGFRVSVVAKDLNRRRGEPMEAGLASMSFGCGNPSDEVMMLARMLQGCRVFAGPVKAEAAVRAVRESSPDVVLVDDGFQHLGLHRDMDVVVLDFDHPLGVGGVMPAGTLREFSSALSFADCLWVNRVPAGRSPEWLSKALGLLSRKASFVNSRPIPVALELPGGGSVDPRGLKVLGFCGIGNPGSFRSTLLEAGCIIEEFVDFPDHHEYSIAELVTLEERRKTLRADLVVTTEKDAVKLGTPGLKLNICALRIELEVWGEADRLVEDIAQIIRRGGRS